MVCILCTNLVDKCTCSEEAQKMRTLMLTFMNVELAKAQDVINKKSDIIDTQQEQLQFNADCARERDKG